MDICQYERGILSRLQSAESALRGTDDAAVRAALACARRCIDEALRLPVLFDLVPHQRRLQELEKDMLRFDAEQEVVLLAEFVPDGRFQGRNATGAYEGALQSVRDAAAAGFDVQSLFAAIEMLRQQLNFTAPPLQQDPESALFAG